MIRHLGGGQTVGEIAGGEVAELAVPNINHCVLFQICTVSLFHSQKLFDEIEIDVVFGSGGLYK